jgi:hypothetical protein
MPCHARIHQKFVFRDAKRHEGLNILHPALDFVQPAQDGLGLTRAEACDYFVPGLDQAQSFLHADQFRLVFFL